MIAKQPAAAPRRVAVIRDYVLTQATWGREMLDSIGELVSKLSDDNQKVMVDHFQPIEDGVLPADASTYDLIVLTGGVYDLTRLNATPEHDPWVANLLDFIRNAVATSPSTKLLGICWGHQAISYALGGKIAYREGGPLIDIADIPLTPKGQEFFKGEKTLRLYKFHRRIVRDAPPGFSYLAEDHEISLSDSNQIMTFQGHPEMTAAIARGLVDDKDPSYLPDPSPEGVARLHANLKKEQDGRKVFERIVSWAFEESEA